MHGAVRGAIAASCSATHDTRKLPSLLQACGTRVYGFSPKFQLYSTTVVSVPSVTYQPTMHVYCKDAAWQLPRDSLLHYKDLPAEYGGSGEVVHENP